MVSDKELKKLEEKIEKVHDKLDFALFLLGWILAFVLLRYIIH